MNFLSEFFSFLGGLGQRGDLFYLITPFCIWFYAKAATGKYRQELWMWAICAVAGASLIAGRIFQALLGGYGFPLTYIFAIVGALAVYFIAYRRGHIAAAAGTKSSWSENFFFRTIVVFLLILFDYSFDVPDDCSRRCLSLSYVFGLPGQINFVRFYSTAIFAFTTINLLILAFQMRVKADR